MADKRVKYIADDGPFCEVGITGKQTSWRRNQSGFVTEANAALLIASGKFVLSSTAFSTDRDGLDSHLADHSAIGSPLFFPGFKPMILPSLVASTTASQAGNVVTVTATAHGIPGVNFEGWRVWYPGSPTIAANWYDGFSYVDANTFTFSNYLAQSVASESVNGGISNTAIVEVGKVTIPGGAFGRNGTMELRLIQNGGPSTAIKTIRCYYGGAYINLHAPTNTQANGLVSLTAAFLNSESKLRGFQVKDHAQTTYAAFFTASVDSSLPQTYSITAQVSAAGDYCGIQSALLFLTKNP